MRFGATDGPLQRPNKLLQAQPKRLAERPQFDHINSSFSLFALGDEGLGLSDLSSELHLRQAGPFPRFTEDLEEKGITS